MIIEFDWFSMPEIINFLNMFSKILDIVRIVVPIGLIIMTTIDIVKKVINPEEKEGQKKILIRAIAALIVFLIPVFIIIVFSFFDIDIDNIDNGSKIVIPTPTIKPTVIPTPVITPTPTSTPSPTPVITPKLDKLSSISFIDCPNSTKAYKVGETVDINTNIPTTFNDKITWTIDNDTAAKITPNSSKTGVSVQLLNRPKLGAVWITVLASGIAKTCYINIYSVDKLEITNCPSNNQIYHVGDVFILNSNLPNTYKGNISWISSLNPNTFIFTPIGDGRDVKVQIKEVPIDKYANIGLGADSKGTSCTIYIE